MIEDDLGRVPEGFIEHMTHTYYAMVDELEARHGRDLTQTELENLYEFVKQETYKAFSH